MFFVVVVFLRYSSVFRSTQCQRVLKLCKPPEPVQVIFILPAEGQPMALVTATTTWGTGATLAQGKFQKIGTNFFKCSGL